MVGVAVAQFAPGADVGQNLDAASALVRQAAARGAHLVVLPEYSSYFEKRMGPGFLEHAQPLDGDFTAAVVELAAETAATIVFGLVERGTADRFRNTAVAVTGDGVVATYRKTHLYDAFGDTESAWVEPGDLEPAQTFLVGDLRVGLQTCYDLRFPEVTRVLADAQVDLVAVPSDWVPGPRKVDHWRTLLAARAIENIAFIAGADQTAPAGVGTSLILDPAGVVLAEAGEDPGIAFAEVDRSRVEEIRTVNPALRLRRYTVVPR